MGVTALGLPRDQILFAAYAGWDAAGAKSFGYPTFWINRQNQSGEELGVRPDATGEDLNDLVAFVIGRGTVRSETRIPFPHSFPEKKAEPIFQSRNSALPYRRDKSQPPE